MKSMKHTTIKFVFYPSERKEWQKENVENLKKFLTRNFPSLLYFWDWRNKKKTEDDKNVKTKTVGKKDENHYKRKEKGGSNLN